MGNRKNAYTFFMDPTHLAAQLRCPTGADGMELGRHLATTNKEPNDWALQLADVEGTDTVLEIGFGPGVALEGAVKRTVGIVHGIELSQVMVNMASERNAEVIKNGKMILRQGDSEHLPYDEDMFDKVLCVNVLYFWEDPVQHLSEIHRVLKDDGFLVLVFLEAETWLPGLRESGLFKPYTAEEVEALAEEAGFTGISIQRKTLPQGNGLALVAMK